MIVRPNAMPAVIPDPRTGYGVINPMRDLTRSWSQGTQRNSQQSIAASQIADDVIECQAERGMSGDFEITHFTSDHTAAYRVEIYVGGSTDKKLMNVPIHVDMVCGVGSEQLYLPESIFLEARNVLGVRFINLSPNVTNKIRFTAHGRRFLDYKDAAQRDEIVRQFYGRDSHTFWLGLDDTALTLTSNQVDARDLMTVPGDGDFEVEYALMHPQGPFRALSRESSSGRPICTGGSVTKLYYTAFFGTAMAPARFHPDNAYFKRLTKVEWFFDELSGNSNTVEISLLGRLLYYPESQAG